MSDYARELTGVDRINDSAERWNGGGQVIGVIDSGIDGAHPDFDDRIVWAVAGVAGGDPDDKVGHGTHVAGIAAGDGRASNGKIRGIAPAANLVIVGIVDGHGKLNLPIDLGDLLDQAAEAGAKIINLSWERPLAGMYDSGSRAVDNFIRRRPDVLVVVAAGNQGSAPYGYPHLYSVGVPATAKNALTVGACASSRPGFDDTWGQYDGARFPAVPTSQHLVAGDPQLVAAFSSRGPTDFNSVKPDVVAPGTAILAPRARKSVDRRFWRPCLDYGDYAYMNGTSMAAPIVSGAAAIVRQYLAEAHQVMDPSAALLKAILVASAQPLPWGRQESEQQQFGYPDFDQGFGRIDLGSVLPHAAAPPDRRLWFEDVSSAGETALESRPPEGSVRKASRRYRFTASGNSTPLRVVMAWTDCGERDVQNCLGIELRGPGGLMARGNADHRWQKVAPALVDPRYLESDRRNNVQGILVDSDHVRGGDYTLRVIASNTLFPPQGYSLCITGPLAGDPVAG